MKKKYILYASSFLVLAIGVLGYIFFLRPYFIENEVHINEKIHLLKEETVQMRFKIVSKPNGDMFLAVKFFDLDGNVVGRFETKYDDGAIVLEFDNVDINLHHIFLPTRMKFIKVGNVKNIELSSYYTRDSYPKVYDSKVLDPILFKEIGRISKYLQESDEESVIEKYGTVTKSRISLAHPGERITYELKVTTAGDIEIL